MVRRKVNPRNLFMRVLLIGGMVLCGNVLRSDHPVRTARQTHPAPAATETLASLTYQK